MGRSEMNNTCELTVYNLPNDLIACAAHRVKIVRAPYSSSLDGANRVVGQIGRRADVGYRCRRSVAVAGQDGDKIWKIAWSSFF